MSTRGFRPPVMPTAVTVGSGEVQRLTYPSKNRKKKTKEEARIAQMVGNALNKATLRKSPLLWLDRNINTGVTTSGQIFPLGQIAAGTGSNARLGLKIRAKRIDYRVLFIASVTNVIAISDLFNNLRFMVLRTRGPYSGITTGLLPNTFQMIDPTGPFTLLKDEIVFEKNVSSGFSAAGSAYASSPEGVWVVGSIPLNYDIIFDGPTATSDQDNMPFLYVVSDSSVTPNPTIEGTFRFWYSNVV